MEVDIVQDVNLVLADVIAMFHGLYPSYQIVAVLQNMR